ncbi:MMPL family transporter [Streptomyces sp. SID13031]|uniref:MMPL family transporter n=1 Tax=Streptomyces sp. SID13031 TaxID=2706046 RepID=UPI0013C5FB53|nr:MMPL family transporter [Streptomyces sp. SID13031]NEA31459.1 MMPL family transporter [Streptomyces sp. SID13031]
MALPEQVHSSPRPGPLGRLGGFAFRHRGSVVLGWIAALALAIGLSSAFGGEFTVDYSTSGSDSQAAQRLLEERFPAQSGATVTVVAHSDAGIAGSRVDVTKLLTELKGVPHVVSAEDPFVTPGGVSADGQTAVARLRLDVVNPADMPVEESRKLIDLVEAQNSGRLGTAIGGQAINLADTGSIGSEGLGLAAAAIILLLTFGSVVAAGLPIIVAIIGLVVSGALTGLVINLADAPEWSTSLATMMGIGIGIDYVLLMVTRFREWRLAGLDPQAATVATLDTAGRSVVVAGSTVVVSLLGLFAMGIPYMRGAALVTITAVLVTVLASVTLFPALLGFLGKHVERLRLPLVRRRPATSVTADGHVDPSGFWLRYSRFVERHRIVAAVAGIGALAALALPFFGVQYGFPDAGNNRTETTTRQAYDQISNGFGPGVNGPLLLAVELPEGLRDQSALPALAQALRETEGVASVSQPQVNPAGDTAVLTVVPKTGPQDAATEDLVQRIREETVPKATSGTDLEVRVGGVVASSIDSTEDLASRIPFLIGGVVLLSMLLLLVSFRSVAVAVKAAVMNLLSVGAAYGVVSLVLDGGWLGQLVGIDTHTPLPPFVPVLMFAVLFGLSMDYEVFLVSRMRESWVRTGDNHRAVTDGLAGTARVITAAALIMIAVFIAFVPSPDIILKVIGIGMATAILLDATIVRLVIVPAVMHILGRVNWWMPQWLSKRLPELHIEGHADHHLPPKPATETPEPVLA